MPAEWAQHKATWLAWPHDTTTFPQRIKQVEQLFATIIYYLHQNEFIELLVLDATMQQRATNILKQHQVNMDKITFYMVDYADVWLRDYGPTFLVNREQNKAAWIKWQYNAYGGKFPELLKDDKVPYQILNQPMYEVDIVMEGGAIEVNGQGDLITTEECLLNPNRNSNLNKQQIERYLQDYLGINQVIWLAKGLVNDHTDGHVDEIARFVNKNTIIYAYADDPHDPNFAILDNNLRILEKARDQNGKPFNLVKLPIPQMHYEDGTRAPVSYANFYIANQLVLVPEFKHKNDKHATKILQSLFPNHKIVGIDCTDLIYGGGSIHCITQQQPV